MDFSYVIVFSTQSGKEIVRTGMGLFYPHDGGFNLEHMLWAMTEEFGRPSDIHVYCKFQGESDGQTTPKRIESKKTTPAG